MKFSELISKEDADHAAMLLAEKTDASDHDAILAALKATQGGRRAVSMASGDIKVFTLNADGVSYTVEVIPGDFDVPDPSAPTP
jgi:hypothetical protein